MTVLICRPDQSDLPQPAEGLVPVLMYGTADRNQHSYIGNGVEAALRNFAVAASPLAFDFLTIALAVTAADTFVSRENAPDRWCRQLSLDIALYDPQSWTRVIPKLQAALGFLTGDNWLISLTDGGKAPPEPRRRSSAHNIVLDPSTDCVSLFSGGLDSTIGILDLAAGGRHPLLVSHAYNRDGRLQSTLLSQLNLDMPRLAVNLSPAKLSGTASDITMRGRSFNFLALAVVAASILGTATNRAGIQIVIPENGFIALNTPLTSRRIGSLSTRTTHPNFLSIMQDVLHDVGETVQLHNPYEFKTKGEMLRECLLPAEIATVAAETMSCSNWKRKGQACGRCVPCLIRRASFAAARMPDLSDYQTPVLQWSTVPEKLDDLLAVTLAIHRMEAGSDRLRASRSGPLPHDLATRQQYDAVIQRGLREMAEYLRPLGLL